MLTISADEMQRHLPTYLSLVKGGEELVITQADEPVAQMTPLPPLVRGRRQFGSCAGEFTVPDDFNDPLPDDVLRDFEGL